MSLTSSLELKPHHRLSGRRGFSLIELLTVITVMSIMMVIALPYMRLSAQTKVRSAGRHLVRYLEVVQGSTSAPPAANSDREIHYGSKGEWNPLFFGGPRNGLVRQL